MNEENNEMDNGETMNLAYWATFLLVYIVLCIFAQVASFYHVFGATTASTANIWLIIKGYVVLYIGTMIGVILAKYIHIGWPVVLWVSLVLIVASLPWLPTHDFVVTLTKPVALLPMGGPILAYAGLPVAKNELKLFKKAGWKMVIITCLTIIGSFIGSVAVAEVVLKLTGQI